MMHNRLLLPVLIAALALIGGGARVRAGNKVTFDSSGVLEMNGKKMFVISVAVPPPPDGKTPWGKDAFAELKDAGCNYMRVTQHKREDEAGPKPGWHPAGSEEMQKNLDALAKHGLYGWIYLYDLGNIKPGATAKEQKLREVIERFKDHPANGGWKGCDEPAWGKVPPENVIHVYKLIHAIDADHPVLILHAPKGEPESILPYMPGTDLTGADIFPIAYPPGRHGDFPNREISVVGDYTKWVRSFAGSKPYWMTLQFAWSGVSKPGKTLRFPTFPQERFMTYEAIIYGARGVNYFGGAIESTLNDRDKPLGYNWTFWQRVIRPVLEEINDKSPLCPALIAPESKLKIAASQLIVVPPGDSPNGPLPKVPADQTSFPAASGLDFCLREVGRDLFLIAAKREGDTVMVRFSGLPAMEPEGEVLFESPRKIKIENGSFDDWFGPNEVHVYRMKRM